VKVFWCDKSELGEAIILVGKNHNMKCKKCGREIKGSDYISVSIRDQKGKLFTRCFEGGRC
jgi:hypothetical protein